MHYTKPLLVNCLCDLRILSTVTRRPPELCVWAQLWLQQKERIVMSAKSNLLGAAATLTVVGGLSAVGTVPSSAATPQCGAHCIEVFSPRFGTAHQPNFVETARGGVARIGAPAILYRASSSNPAEDWVVPTGGPVPVSQFYADGMVSAAVDSHYGTLDAAQIEFAPYGKATGLCTGVPEAPFANESLSLQPCSVPGNTVWIIDPAAAPSSLAGSFALINSSTTSFSHPFAMTYAYGPPAPIRVDQLRFSPGGTVPETQLFGAAFGIVS